MGITGTVDTDLVSGDAKREMLIPSPKENLMPMHGYTITLMVTGHHGILGIMDMVAIDFVSGDVRREKLKLFLMPMLKPTITYGVTGQQDIMAIAVLMDFTTGTALA